MSAHVVAEVGVEARAHAPGIEDPFVITDTECTIIIVEVDGVLGCIRADTDLTDHLEALVALILCGDGRQRHRNSDHGYNGQQKEFLHIRLLLYLLSLSCLGWPAGRATNVGSSIVGISIMSFCYVSIAGSHLLSCKRWLKILALDC